MRHYAIDSFRGMTVISMVLYHMVWDIVYLFGVDWAWYRTTAAYVWQQSICWSFILLSGFCFSFGRHKLQRGLTVSAAGMLIMLVTAVLMPEQSVLFGVLTMLGSAMLLMLPLEKVLIKVPPRIGLSVSLLLFFLFRNMNEGWLGFEALRLVRLPGFLYRNLFTAYVGFPPSDFASTDYFSLFPWFFLFVGGYFLHKIFAQAEKLGIFSKPRCKWAEWIGRHCLQIYLLHQPVGYAVLWLVFSFV